jgi:hypothetical protein
MSSLYLILPGSCQKVVKRLEACGGGPAQKSAVFRDADLLSGRSLGSAQKENPALEAFL